MVERLTESAHAGDRPRPSAAPDVRPQDAPPAAQQHDMFGVDESLVAVAAVRKTERPPPATPLQRRYARLLAKATVVRSARAAWEPARERIRARVLGEIEPLLADLRAEYRAFVQVLDELLQQPRRKRGGLTARRRETLREALESLLDELYEQGENEPDPALAAIRRRHLADDEADAPTPADELALAEALVAELLGPAVVRRVKASTAEELFAAVERELRDAYGDDGPYAGARPRRRRTSAAARASVDADPAPAEAAFAPAEAAPAPAAPPALRDLFRRLVSAVHPDRECEEDERARRTALMQRVNRAYADEDLLGLLEVQSELEGVEPAQLGVASAERLATYCDLLQRQIAAIESELRELESAHGVDSSGRTHFPKVLIALAEHGIAEHARELRTLIEKLRRDRAALQDPARRNATIDAIEAENVAAEQAEADERAFVEMLPAMKHR